MLRLLILAALAVIACRILTGRWPWELMRGPATRTQTRLRARRLLGVGKAADRREILAAHKRLIATVHPDKGGSNAQVHDADAARDLLLDDLPRQSEDLK